MHDKGIRRALAAEQRLFGRVVRETRARRALSQEALGEASGLHRNYVGALERGEASPTLRTLLRVSAGLGVALSELFALYERRRAEASA